MDEILLTFDESISIDSEDSHMVKRPANKVADGIAQYNRGVCVGGVDVMHGQVLKVCAKFDHERL
jgi:hypothetical protein